MNLSPHFELSELLNSITAIEDGFDEQFTPSQDIISNLTSLVVKVLEPLRIKLNAPIKVTSGFRCPRLNTKVGGEPDSQHVIGQAADTITSLSTNDWYQFVKTAQIPFDQLIIEHNDQGDYWVHISYNSLGTQRGQCYIGTLQSEGGTIVQNDGVVNFNNLV